MTQLTISADEDVRIELGLSLGPLWVGKQWTDEEREEECRETSHTYRSDEESQDDMDAYQNAYMDRQR